MTGVPEARRRLGQTAQTEWRVPWEDRGRDWGAAATSRGMPGRPAATRSCKREYINVLPSTQVCGHLLRQPQEILTAHVLPAAALLLEQGPELIRSKSSSNGARGYKSPPRDGGWVKGEARKSFLGENNRFYEVQRGRTPRLLTRVSG